jgi:outer membrane protein
VNRKRILFFVVLGATACVFGWQTAGAQLKVGYIDSQRILTTLPTAVDAQKRLDAEQAKWGQELQRMQGELQTLQEKLDQQSLLLSEAKKKEQRDEIQALYVRAQQYQSQKWGQGGEYFKLQEELLQPVFDTINAAIHRIGDEEGYDFIFDSVAGNILHAKEDHDLTEKVLKELEKESTSGTSK